MEFKKKEAFDSAKNFFLGVALFKRYDSEIHYLIILLLSMCFFQETN